MNESAYLIIVLVTNISLNIEEMVIRVNTEMESGESLCQRARS